MTYQSAREMESKRPVLVWTVVAAVMFTFAAVHDANAQVCCDGVHAQALERAGSESTATYVVTFSSTWSAQTHPFDFPPNPHFSGLIGGTHDPTVSFWEVGSPASDGIESMAETGSKTLLQNEVTAAIDAGAAESVLSGGGISLSPGSVALTFDVSSSYPLVSLVSMLAPSPDWFVGVSALSLQEQGSWVQSKTVPLVLHDAGTDSGTTYRAANDDTQPPDDIAPLAASPFDQSNLVGTFTFELQSVVSTEEVGEVPGLSLEISPPYPNPFSTMATIEVRAAQGEELEIGLYDGLGRMVRQLYSGQVGGRDMIRVRVEAAGLPSGFYLVKAVGHQASGVRGMILVR